jgi:hypothetical protein
MKVDLTFGFQISNFKKGFSLGKAKPKTAWAIAGDGYGYGYGVKRREKGRK